MPDCGIQGRYDAGFLDASGNFVGLMLVKDKNGVPKYAEANDPGLASQFFTGQANYTNFQPLKKIHIGQSDYRSGFGQEYADSADPKRYYYGINIDPRFKDMVVAGPLATAATLPTLFSLTDGGMEIWSDANTLTNWTKSGTGTLTREATTIHGGTYAAILYANAGASETITQDCANWSNNFRGKLVSASVWVNLAATTGNCRIAINDGIGTTYSSFATEDGTYNKLTVSRTLDAAATRIRIQVVATGGGAATITAYVDDLALNAYGAHFSCSAEFNDDLYFASNDILLKVDDSTGTISYEGGFPAAITDLETFTDDQLYIALGPSNFYYYMTTAGAVTVTDSYAKYFKTIGTTLYKVLLPRSVYTATAPTTDGGWSAATTIGSTAENITAIDEIGGVPYIGKENVPYYINGSGTPLVLIQDLISEKSSTSGKNMHVWQGRLYYPCGTQGLYEYDPVDDSTVDISPSKYITNSADFDGQVVALASDAQWLFAFIDNGTKVELLAGRWETVDGTTAWSWHSLAELTLAGGETAFASSVYARRLWIGSTSSADSLYYYPLPSAYGNIVSDTTYSFQTGGYLITPYLHAELKSDSKAFYELTLAMSGTTANVYWEAYYEKLGDSSWVEINSSSKFKTSPTTTSLIPVDGSSVKPASTMMRFKFKTVTNDTTKTPVLLNYSVKAIWYPRNEKFILCQVYASDGLILKDGRMDETQSAATIRTAVDAWNNPSTAWPRAFYPIYWDATGDTVYAKLQPADGVPFLTLINDEKTNSPVYVYNLNLMVVNSLTY